MASNSSDTGLNRYPATVVVETITITIISLMIFVCNIGNIRVLKTITFWHKSTVYLLMNLALSDMCVAIFTASAIYPCVTDREISMVLCQLQSFLGGTSVTVSLITLMYISIDRYIIIAHPLRHRSFMSNKTVFFMAILSWAVSLLLYIWVFSEDLLGTQYNPDSFLCSANFTNNLSFVIVLVCFIYLPANAMIIFSYGTIFCIAKRHSSSIQSQQLNNCNTTVIPKRRRSHKAAGMFIVVFGMFNLCWAPYIFLVIYRGLLFKGNSPHWINFILPWLAMSNSFVNTFIYYIYNAQYRRAMKGLCGCNVAIYTPQDTMETNF